MDEKAACCFEKHKLPSRYCPATPRASIRAVLNTLPAPHRSCIRALANRAFGLVNSGKTDTLVERMRMCLDGQLDVMRTEPTWFTAEALRSHGISKETSVWRTSLQSSLPPKQAITINPSALLTSIMGQTDT